jgi:membrane-associated phospholipid phosphatase
VGHRPERVAVTFLFDGRSSRADSSRADSSRAGLSRADSEPRQWLTAMWLVVVAAAQFVALYEVIRLFVNRRRGQVLDTIALGGNWIGSDRVGGVVATVLSAMSVVSVLAATCVVAVIALARRRTAVGLAAILLIAGATLTANLLKDRLVRPNLGVDPERAVAGNSLPSGHATVAASVAVALVLVLPPRARGVGALVGAGYAAVVGVATMSAGWHRPSDSIAAFLIVGIWAAVAGLGLLITPQVGLLMGRPGSLPRRRVVSAEPGESHRLAFVLLLAAGVALLAAAVLTMAVTDQVAVPPSLLPYRRLFIAYAGASAGIAGAAATMMALVLATVHRVVPERTVVGDSEPALTASS